MKTIHVLVVDDSAVVRQVLGALFAQVPDFAVQTAADPLIAIERMRRCWPDVLVLDVEMPRMDGLTFLRKLMAERPTPVVICSTLTDSGARTTIDAMAAGAVAIVTKPRLGLRQFLDEAAAELVATVRGAANARVARRAAAAELPAAQAKLSADAVLPPGGPHAMIRTTERFTAAFAERLDSVCEVEVREARTQDRVIPGRVLIAPGGRHLLLRRSGAHYHVDVVDGPPVNRHRPSVDVLFRSVARAAGANATGIIMTGMGDDGAAGLLEMRQAGARTLAQDEASCVVYGMPKEAVRRGAAERSVGLEQIAREITAAG